MMKPKPLSPLGMVTALDPLGNLSLVVAVDVVMPDGSRISFSGVENDRGPSVLLTHSTFLLLLGRSVVVVEVVPFRYWNESIMLFRDDLLLLLLLICWG